MQTIRDHIGPAIIGILSAVAMFAFGILAGCAHGTNHGFWDRHEAQHSLAD